MSFKICTWKEFFAHVKEIDTCLGHINHFEKFFELRQESFGWVTAVRMVEDVDPLNNNDCAQWRKFVVNYEFTECMKITETVLRYGSSWLENEDGYPVRACRVINWCDHGSWRQRSKGQGTPGKTKYQILSNQNYYHDRYATDCRHHPWIWVCSDRRCSDGG